MTRQCFGGCARELLPPSRYCEQCERAMDRARNEKPSPAHDISKKGRWVTDRHGIQRWKPWGKNA